MNLLEADHKNKIYCGAEIFEVIMDKFQKVASTKGPFFLGGVSFIKLSMLKPNQLLTMDPALKSVLEQLDDKDN